ncbi:MAG: 30S ribosomal protein S16 [Sedimentisphaerales bacterium]
MAVKLRLMRMGRRHKPFFRLNAIDTRTPRDGKIIEKLGHYDPIEKDPAKQLVLKKDRIEYWLGVGAVPSETVAELIAKIGIESEHYKQVKARRKRAKLAARKKNVPFDNTQRLIAKKAAEKAAAEKPAEAAAEKPAEKTAEKPAEKTEKKADKK